MHSYKRTLTDRRHLILHAYILKSLPIMIGLEGTEPFHVVFLKSQTLTLILKLLSQVCLNVLR